MTKDFARLGGIRFRVRRTVIVVLGIENILVLNGCC
jgi:hypothetical protein